MEDPQSLSKDIPSRLDSQGGVLPRRKAGDPRLPCLYKNKGIEPREEDGNNRTLCSAEIKTAIALTANAAHLCKWWGLDRVGFLTLTTPDVLSYWTPEGWAEAHKRFRSFRTNVFPRLFGENAPYIRVVEPQKRGAIHWHIVIGCDQAIRPGFDFGAFVQAQDIYALRGDCASYRESQARYVKSASATLRRLWRDLRESCKEYGLGRHELLPVKDKSAMACYVGKYIGKGITLEHEAREDGQERPKGARRVSYSRGWRVANSQCSWVDGGGALWRAAIKYVSGQMGYASLDDWRAVHGPRWAYQLGPSIIERYKREVEGVPA